MAEKRVTMKGESVKTTHKNHSGVGGGMFYFKERCRQLYKW